MPEIKNISDANLKDDDIVKACCKKCGKEALFRITIVNDGIIGRCGKCKEYITLKLFPKQQSSTPTVTCPYCHSTDTKKISTMSKAGSVAMFGVFAMGKVSKQWHCNDCKSDF